MVETDLYPIIFKRKSIRNYDLTSLDENTLKEISNHLQTLKPIYEDIKIELRIVSLYMVKRRIMKKAPHYIAVLSESKDGYLTNVGFMLQQMDLFFSERGIGCCWQGIPQPTKELLNSSNLEFVIFLAFGKPSEKLHRTDVSQFKRKSLKEITDIKDADDLLEPARLAPSATNSQPWFFTGDDKILHVYGVKPGFIKSLMIKKYIPIDVGIAIYHLKVAAEHFGKKVTIFFDEPAVKNLPKKSEYFGSLKME
jgi:nitroreductase